MICDLQQKINLPMHNAHSMHAKRKQTENPKELTMESYALLPCRPAALTALLLRNRLSSRSRPVAAHAHRGSHRNRKDGTQLTGCCVAVASGADAPVARCGSRRALRRWESNLGLSALNSMFIAACEVCEVFRNILASCQSSLIMLSQTESIHMMEAGKSQVFV